VVEAIGDPTEGAIPALIATLADDDHDVRAMAARALRGFREKAAKAVPALIEAYRAGPAWTSAHAADALAWVGPAGQAAVPALREGLLAAQEAEARAMTARALSVHDPGNPDVVPALVLALKGDDRARAAALETLGWMKEQARDAVPALRRLLDDPDASVREKATDVLRRIGGMVEGQR
jgi:HEAT repeat protein